MTHIPLRRINRWVYACSRAIGCGVFPLWIRFHRLNFAVPPAGGCLLVCNHISHFDPPLLATALRRPIEFMTMKELFSHRLFSRWLHAVGTFPVQREHHDFRAVRETIRRLTAGRLVGVFPEGGIRLGKESILGGAPASRSCAALAHLGGVPIRTCLILGSDQLYDWRSVFRRPPVYLIYGEELSVDPALPKRQARDLLTRQMVDSFHRLYQTLLARGKITAELYPRSAQERWDGSLAA